MLEILRRTYYRVIPKELETFSRFLTSSVPVKSFNIERLQCIMLKVCHFDFTSFSGCDFSRVYMLIQTACSLACTLGLNRDIEIPINSHDQVYIENLWWWILYMDVQVSFNLGIALQINGLPIGRFNYSPMEDRQDVIFRKSILMLRSILEKIYDKNNIPSVKQLILDAKEFVNLNYKSLSYYMSPDSCDFNERIEVHTLLLLLTSISNLSNIQRYFFNDKGFEIFNTSIHLSFTSLYISIAVLNSYFKMDIEDPHYESTMKFGGLPPHIQLGMWVTYHTIGRVLYEMYGTLFSSLLSPIPQSAYTEEFDFSQPPFESFQIPTDHYISLKNVSKSLNSAFDTFYAPDCKQLLKIMKKHYSFLFIFSLENICRMIFENGLRVNQESQNTTNAVPSLDMDENINSREIKNIFTNSFKENGTTDLFWDHYDSSIAAWMNKDLEPFLSEWFEVEEQDMP